MAYTVRYSDQAYKDLIELNKEVAVRIKKKFIKITNDPLLFVKTLEGVPLYSLRVGDYRLILDINLGSKQILVIKIGRRKNVYKKF